MCLYKFGARDSWLNNWEHRGEDMYCPRALLKLLGSGTTFFFPVKDTPEQFLSCNLPVICQAATLTSPGVHNSLEAERISFSFDLNIPPPPFCKVSPTPKHVFHPVGYHDVDGPGSPLVLPQLTDQGGGRLLRRFFIYLD